MQVYPRLPFHSYLAVAKNVLGGGWGDSPILVHEILVNFIGCASEQQVARKHVETLVVV